VEVSNEGEKKPFYKKKWFIITVAILAVLGLIPKGGNDSGAGGSNTDQKSSVSTETPKKTETASSVTEPSLETRLGKELESIKAGIDFSTYRGSISSLQIELALFNLWGKMINEGTKSTNQNEVKLAQQLKTQVVKMQSKEFPLMRKEYVSVSRDLVWKDNIQVNASGPASSTITFTSGLFLNNKNISDSQDKLSKILTDFRFQKCQYKAYEAQESFSYYSLKSPKDGEIID
jgi:hypothetical protein